MKRILIAVLLVTAGAFGQAKPDRIQREVRHEILMVPNINVFDNIAYKVDGPNVTLMGSVTQPTTKSQIENAVRSVEGVETVTNQIEVLPLSPLDEGIRRREYVAIYGFGNLERYAMSVVKPIRIVVKNGHVTLEGVVDTQADKDTAGVRANGVSDVFSVTNNLQVVKDK